MKVPQIPSIQPYTASEQRQNQKETSEPLKEKKSVQLEEKQVKNAVEELNQLMADQSQHYLKYKYHDKAEEYYVQVMDAKTDEVIREIPSKELLDYFSNMKKFIGLLYDQSI